MFSAFIDELIVLAQATGAEDALLDAQVKGKSPGIKRPLGRRTSKEEIPESEREEQRPSAA